VRKYSNGSNIIPVLSPESIEKETKRLRTRYKIINEITETENNFLQDMVAMDEGYSDLCFECSIITARHKQTIFGRTKSIVTFSNVFYQTLINSTESFANYSEDQIVEARFDELVELDAQTSIGEAFWSSVSSFYDILLSIDGKT
jgi:hypothetical protein